MDGDYPTEEELQELKEWPSSGSNRSRCEHLLDLAKDLWIYEDYFSREGDHYHVSTGGWSGHEDVIDALASNYIFWALCWQQTNRGGHYKFELPKEKS